MALEFKEKVLCDPEGRIGYRMFAQGGKTHYHVQVWLDGPDAELDEVTRVDYVLHPTFRWRERSSESRSDKFAIDFWTWGMFTVRAAIHFAGGRVEERQFYLSYQLPADTGDNYVNLSA